jgi:hypothetical protein
MILLAMSPSSMQQAHVTFDAAVIEVLLVVTVDL